MIVKYHAYLENRRISSGRFLAAALVISSFLSMPALSSASEALTLEKVLEIAIQNNPEISAAVGRVEAEHAMVTPKFWPESPHGGWMKEDKLNFMEVQNGPMNFWTISQEVEFPLKLMFKGSAQKQRAYASEQDLQTVKWGVRQQVVTAYYNYWGLRKIISIFNAEREILRDMSRVVETRRATGKVPQQDEMKVHVEQTKLENDILLTQQELDTAFAQLNAGMNRDADSPVVLSEIDLKVPIVNVKIEELKESPIIEAPQVKKSQYLSFEANYFKKQAQWGWAPTTLFSFRKPFTNAEPGAYGIGLEVSIPLWFLMKDIPEIRAASKLAVEADSNFTRALRLTQSDFVGLSSKVRSTARILEIYETALIPQAGTTFNSSRAAYQAGETNFLELLDSQRSYFAVRIAFYQLLTQYVENISRLEQLLGRSISSIPTGGLS